MTWIVTNGKEGKQKEYVTLKKGGFFYTKRRDSAMVLGSERTARMVAYGMSPKAYVVAVIDQPLNVEA